MIGYPEMCATNLEIMRTDFTDYEQNVHTLFILILIFCPLDYLENCQISVAVGVWQRTPHSEQFSFYVSITDFLTDRSLSILWPRTVRCH